MGTFTLPKALMTPHSPASPGASQTLLTRSSLTASGSPGGALGPHMALQESQMPCSLGTGPSMSLYFFPLFKPTQGPSQTG